MCQLLLLLLTLFHRKNHKVPHYKLKEYISKLPSYDQKSEALIPVLNRQIPLKAHAHQANDIFTAIRIAKEFGVGLTLEHVTEGHLIVEELVKENLPLAVGPTFGHATKVELLNKSWTTPGILAKAGCHVSIISDAPVTPLHNLPLYAGMAMKAGMDPYDALRAITIGAACSGPSLTVRSATSMSWKKVIPSPSL